jgi:DNA polymerase-1
MKRERILLTDGNNLSLRALYGCAALYDFSGFPTGCLMTSVRMICRAAVAVKPLRTIVVWDAGHSPYRKKLFPDYKYRAPLDEEDPKVTIMNEWKQQVDALQKYLPLLGIGQIQVGGCEADDVIYRLKRIVGQEGFETIVATTDADFFQMVGEDCGYYHIAKEKLYGVAETVEEHGVSPQHWVDYRAMTGDDSDNIPGIKGIGPKKAADIITTFGRVENFYHHVDSVDKGWLEKNGKKHHRDLAQNRDIVARNKKLMDLSALPLTEVPQEKVEALLNQALALEPNVKEFWEVCKKHQLNTLLSESHMWSQVYKR